MSAIKDIYFNLKYLSLKEESINFISSTIYVIYQINYRPIESTATGDNFVENVVLYCNRSFSFPGRKKLSKIVENAKIRVEISKRGYN